MILRYSPGIRPEVGHYVGVIFNYVTGGIASGTNAGGGTGTIGSQTISPASPVVGVGGTVTFTTNYPAAFTAPSGSFVVAADSLSAVWTAPNSTGNVLITITNLNDPGNVATTTAEVTTFGPLTVGDIVPGGPVGRSIIAG